MIATHWLFILFESDKVALIVLCICLYQMGNRICVICESIRWVFM